MWLGWGEGGCLPVELSGLQAVVKAAKEPVGQVAQGGGVAVAGGSSALVVSVGAGGGGEGGEGPEMAGVGEALFFHSSVHAGPARTRRVGSVLSKRSPRGLQREISERAPGKTSPCMLIRPTPAPTTGGYARRGKIRICAVRL